MIHLNDEIVSVITNSIRNHPNDWKYEGGGYEDELLNKGYGVHIWIHHERFIVEATSVRVNLRDGAGGLARETGRIKVRGKQKREIVAAWRWFKKKNEEDIKAYENRQKQDIIDKFLMNSLKK